MKWHMDFELCQSVSGDIEPQSLPVCTPDANFPRERPSDAPNIILQKDNLRKHIRENLKCKKCALTLQHQGNPAFLSFLEIVWCKPITL